MNKPDKAGEPSMDEILASIRKIIADEPAGANAGPDRRSVNPLLESINPVSRRADASASRDERLLPPADRLSEALRALPQTNAFDDDLADLLEDSPSSGPRVNGSHGGAKGPGDEWSPWQALQSQPGADADETPATAKHVNGAKRDPLDFLTAFPRSDETDKTVANVSPSPAVSESPVTAAEPTASIPTVTTEPVAAQVSPAAAEKPSVAHVLFPELPHTLAPYLAAAEAARIATPASTPATPAAFPFDPVVPRSAQAAQQAPQQAQAALSSVERAHAQAVASAIGAAERDTQVAAATALGALAAGLAAASGGTSGLTRPAPAPPRSGAAKEQDAGAAPSLEGMIADMVRPMLQQWIAENMPRIMEKALRVEVAKSFKPDGGRMP